MPEHICLEEEEDGARSALHYPIDSGSKKTCAAIGDAHIGEQVMRLIVWSYYAARHDMDISFPSELFGQV